MAIYTVGNVVTSDTLVTGNIIEGDADTNAKDSSVPTTAIATAQATADAAIPSVPGATVGNLSAFAAGGILVDSGSSGGGSSTTLEFQIAGKYFSSQATAALDTPVAIKFDTSDQATANVTLTNETDITFINVGLYFVKLFSYASTSTSVGYDGAIYHEIVSGSATLSFLQGVQTGTSGNQNNGREIDTFIPVRVTAPNTVIRIMMSQRTGAGTTMLLKGFPAATNTPQSPSASIEVWKEVATVSNSIHVVDILPFGLTNPTPIVIDDNEYYTLEWVGEYLAAPLGWWRFVPKVAMDGLTVSGFFTLERPGRTPDTFTLTATTGTDIWINNNNTAAPPGSSGRYNDGDENKLSGYLLVQDTTPFYREYSLNATEDVFVMYSYMKSV